jgi:VanZ family protein
MPRGSERMNRVITWLEKRPKAAWTLVIAYAVLIFSLSSMSHTPQPVEVTDSVGHELLTTTEHAIEYIIFGMLLLGGFRSLEKTRKDAAYLAFLIAVLYAATDEIHQYFVPYRICDVKDLLADSAGALAGIIMAKKQVKD